MKKTTKSSYKSFNLFKKRNKKIIKQTIFFVMSLLLIISFINHNLVKAQGKTTHETGLEKLELVRVTKDQKRITLRLKGTGKNGPIMNLKKYDFQIKLIDTNANSLVAPDEEKSYSNIKFRWKSPQDTVPDDAYIIVLFDMSGSMQCSTDLNRKGNCNKVPKGQRKYDAAIDTLKNFVEEAKTWKGKTQVSIVPFGNRVKTGNCNFSEPFVNVSPDNLNDFQNVESTELTKFLNTDLSNKTPCTATNIYESLYKSVEFLTNDSDERFYPVNREGEPTDNQPRLSIILFTDGFDTDTFNKDETIARGKQQQQIDKIATLLKKNPQLAIHTLGYGLTPKQLGQKYGLERAVNWNKDIDWGNDKTKLIPRVEYLDEQAINNISSLTNGISRIAGNSKEITESLKLFLQAILGEYEIIYKHPNPQRGRVYQVISSVNPVESNSKEYRFTVIGITAPPNIVAGAFGISIIFIGSWFIVYFLWRKELQS